MDTISGLSIAQRITRVFLIGAAALLLTYGLLFKTSILVTENKNSMHRLVLVAPHYFAQYQQDAQGKVVIDPLLTMYDDHALLPQNIRNELPPQWTGVESVHFEDDSEFAIFAKKQGNKTYYLVEDSNAIEWSDGAFILIELLLFSCGLVLFLIAAFTIKSSANKIAAPFSQLAHTLASDSGDNFNKLTTQGPPSYELQQTLSAINNYRDKISQAITREQSFTRYVSHELRTPMTIIKGSVSLLKKHQDASIDKQCKRINQALDEMEALTQTFLLLARDEVDSKHELIINQLVIEQQQEALSSYIHHNNCTITIQVLDNITLPVETTLFNALLKNLLLNAINCTPNGNISVFMDQQQLSVIDNGSGLDNKHRGYEGFGIGLIIVKDICKKYHWSFSLANNPDKGCTAQVTFNPANKT